MKVDVSLSALDVPPLDGPHELAWSYLLDAIFADAYHAGVAFLHVSVPDPALVAEVELRAELSDGRPSGDTRALALLGAMRDVPQDAERLYLLAFGMMAPAALRRLPKHPISGWSIEHRLGAYTWKARAWGAAIRWAAFRKRPDLVDRAMLAMRRDFARPGDATAYYRLGTWSRT